MRKNIFVICLLLVTLLSSTPVAFAENSPTPTPPTTTPTPTATMSDRKGRSEERMKQVLEKQQKLREEQDRRMAEFRQKIEKRESEIKSRIASREAQLKDRLEAFKNKTKANIAERISSNLNTVSKNRVAAMTKHLDTMDNLLTKVKAKAAEAKTDGKNVASIETAITSAETAIAGARAALVTQAGKDYTLTVTSEETVRDDAKAKRDTLLSDLKAVHEKVKLARKALIDAIKAAYGTLGKEIVDGSLTGTPTPTLSTTTTVTVTATPTQTATVTPTTANATSTPTPTTAQ